MTKMDESILSECRQYWPELSWNFGIWINGERGPLHLVTIRPHQDAFEVEISPRLPDDADPGWRLSAIRIVDRDGLESALTNARLVWRFG